MSGLCLQYHIGICENKGHANTTCPAYYPLRNITHPPSYQTEGEPHSLLTRVNVDFRFPNPCCSWPQPSLSPRSGSLLLSGPFPQKMQSPTTFLNFFSIYPTILNFIYSPQTSFLPRVLSSPNPQTHTQHPSSSLPLPSPVLLVPPSNKPTYHLS